MYKYVLFDMDGTVLDTLQDLTDAVNVTISKFGYPEKQGSEIAHFLGNGARHLIAAATGKEDGDGEVDIILKEYLPYYNAHCLDKTGPYPGIIELMHELKAKGVKMAVISNKPDAAVQDLSAELFPELLELSVGETADVKRKPAPDMVLKAMEELGAESDECVYVGDTEVDLATARNAGLPCIAVSWGFRSKEELIAAGAETIIDRPQEIIDFY